MVLPLRNPLLLAKRAATIDVLSKGRLILGVASGDRPEEYPAFGADFENRGQTYRDAVAEIRTIWHHSSTRPNTENKILPPPVAGTIPLIAVGRGQQSTKWAAENMDAYMTYHRPGPMMGPVVKAWNTATPAGTTKPVITTMLVDLHENPNAPAEPISLGARLGARALSEYLHGLDEAGIAHVALNFRRSRRPVEEVLTEIAETVLPAFNRPPQPAQPSIV